MKANSVVIFFFSFFSAIDTSQPPDPHGTTKHHCLTGGMPVLKMPRGRSAQPRSSSHWDSILSPAQMIKFGPI